MLVGENQKLPAKNGQSACVYPGGAVYVCPQWVNDLLLLTASLANLISPPPNEGPKLGQYKMIGSELSFSVSFTGEYPSIL